MRGSNSVWKKQFEHGIARLDIGEGPICVAMHGFGECSDVWKPFISTFSDAFRIVAPDLRGHGDSSWNVDNEYAFEGFLADLEQLLDSIGDGRKILIGHSLGGQLVAEVAIRRPELAAGVILVDVGVGQVSEGDESMHRIQSGYDYMMMNHPSIEAYADILASHRPLLPYSKALEIAEFSLSEGDNGHYVPKSDPGLKVDRCRTAFDVARLSQIEVPSLVVRGAWSAVLPMKQAEMMANRLGNCEVLTIPRAGHAVITDNAEQLNEKLKPFLMAFTKPSDKAQSD